MRGTNDVIELFPEYGNGYFYKALAHYGLSELEAALADFTTAKKLYQSQSLTIKVTAQEEKEAKAGL